jgi:hypothetical protein
VTKRPQFAEQAAGHHKCAEIGVTNVHISLKSRLDMANVLKKSCDKRPQFVEEVAGHHKCPKIMRQNVHTSQKSRLDIANVLGKIL